ncbi:MAG: Hpt domain-containing protein, partial [Candidatus Polarisedimenticolia bacterium]
ADGDASLLLEILLAFLQDAPRRMAAIDAAAGSGEATRIADAAHALKGALLSLSSTGAAAAAARLEESARSGDLPEAARQADLLRSEMERLTLEVGSFVRRPPA